MSRRTHEKRLPQCKTDTTYPAASTLHTPLLTLQMPLAVIAPLASYQRWPWSLCHAHDTVGQVTWDSSSNTNVSWPRDTLTFLVHVPNDGAEVTADTVQADNELYIDNEARHTPDGENGMSNHLCPGAVSHPTKLHTCCLYTGFQATELHVRECCGANSFKKHSDGLADTLSPRNKHPQRGLTH